MDSTRKIELVRTAIATLGDPLAHCAICPRRCGADRKSGSTGYCRAGASATVYSFGAHLGEEPPISGIHGSGTIFFAHCNMRCVYCQNYRFSQLDTGREVSDERLADIMLELQQTGCHNINLVSPTHYLPQILHALAIALPRGLSIPLIYNTSGYELAQTIAALDGIVDVYLPDMRYANGLMAARYSDAPDYVEHNRAAIREMHRQVDRLVIGQGGTAVRGLIIRLLAIPGNISGTTSSLRFIRDEISKETFLSVMSQYFPTYKAHEYTELSRGISPAEYKNIVDEAILLGLNNGWIQDIPEGSDTGFRGTDIAPRKDI